jgi:hypothetical protein
MLRFSHLVLRIIAAGVAAMTLALVGGTPASAVSASTARDTPPTWTLVDFDTPVCAGYNDPRTLYFFVALKGTWSVPIQVSLTGMPDGLEPFGPALIEPGSADGHIVQSLAAFRLYDVPYGRYVGQLRATGGTVTQTVPAILDVRRRC